MKILITGKNGQVGWELSRSLMPFGEVIAVGRNECDLSRPEKLTNNIRNIRPDVIINAAAYTAVDKAEEEEALANTINGTAVGVLAEEARKLKALLVHYSTDYVFDGTKSEPYNEEDIANPINAYGRSKLLGEEFIRQVGCEHLILRTTWVYAARGNNFVKTIVRLARERRELNIVDDQYGTPTWARNIADVTALLIAKLPLIKEGGLGERVSGIYHLTASGSTTWYEFANVIMGEASRRGLLDINRLPKLDPIPTEAYPLPAQRPKYSRLDTEKLKSRFDVHLPDWRSAVTCCIADMQQ